MKKLIECYQKLTFLQGVALAICLTSLISIAATNLPGFFVFAPNTPISSSEVNNNFEKIAGNIVAKAMISTASSISNVDFRVPANCATCNEYRKKLYFDTVAFNDSNFKTATDTDSILNAI